MHFNVVRRGQGKPLLLIHGLGSSWRSWEPVLDVLSPEREVIAMVLPGFGHTPPLPGKATFQRLADAVADFLHQENLIGVDAVGSSMGARLVLELARRGALGAVVSLDPGGFWRGWEKVFFYQSVKRSVDVIRLLQPVMPALTRSDLGRTVLFAQFSSHPWTLGAQLSLTEMRSFAASPSVDEVLLDLVEGPPQQGVAPGQLTSPLVIGWGRHDRVCLPRQAQRALRAFPGASLHWFEHSGHFPHWDMPEQTAELILKVTR